MHRLGNQLHESEAAAPCSGDGDQIEPQCRRCYVFHASTANAERAPLHQDWSATAVGPLHAERLAAGAWPSSLASPRSRDLAKETKPPIEGLTDLSQRELTACLRDLLYRIRLRNRRQ